MADFFDFISRIFGHIFFDLFLMVTVDDRSEAGEGHKITVYVKYEDQLKEGCVDSDGKKERVGGREEREREREREKERNKK